MNERFWRDLAVPLRIFPPWAITLVLLIAVLAGGATYMMASLY